MSRSKMSEYWIWKHIWSRCTNKRNPKYNRYGKRGIRVCSRWRSFAMFLKDMGLRPSSKHSIERKDNNGDYTPKNCRWATQYEQCRNKSNNIFVVTAGKKMVLKDAAEAHGVSPWLAYERVARGWTPERAATTPPRSHA